MPDHPLLIIARPRCRRSRRLLPSPALRTVSIANAQSQNSRADVNMRPGQGSGGP